MSLPSTSEAPSVTTSAVTVLSSAHGRQRREERKIGKRDLQAAVRYGSREQGHPCPRTGAARWKYTFQDIVYVTDETSRREITSWPAPGAGLDVEKVQISGAMMQEHHQAVDRIKRDPSSWTSHTVVVVDQSGSMRKTDIADGATRSDAVWLTLAVDFVHKQLESGEARATDVVSVISMNARSTVLLQHRPMDWVLFNDLVELLRSSMPKEPGNYLPALELAEQLLLSNTSGSCALLLLFLSDGKPSDEVVTGPGSLGSGAQRLAWAHVGVMCHAVENFASRFGRRLSVHTIGFAGPSEDFFVLQCMSAHTRLFGGEGGFQAPSLSMASLGFAISSVTSSLTQTRVELTELGGSRQRTVRDVRRESLLAAPETRVSEQWDYYHGHEIRRYKWRPASQDWVRVERITECAVGVAMKRCVFGEGAERMVSKFREVGEDRVAFVGPRMVAKQSRFVEDMSHGTMNEDNKMFHKIFCQTQMKAEHLAEIFNQRVALIPGVTARTPRVTFLDCSVFEICVPGKPIFGILVEKMLDVSKYKKFNSNNGFVDGQTQSRPRAAPLPNSAPPAAAAAALGIIEESDEEGGEDEHEDDSVRPSDDSLLRIVPEDVPQAFTHFTYRHTKRKMMVCDLQGVFDEGAALFELTDPVIHYSSSRGRVNVFGRTDRGKKGITAFFKTHVCNDLCKALNRTWYTKHKDRQQV